MINVRMKIESTKANFSLQESHFFFLFYFSLCYYCFLGVFWAVCVAPPTQGTWRSNDYVSAIRLVDIGFDGVGR